MFEFYKASLEALRGKGRLRTLAPRAGADFSSNDYLGLSDSDELKDAVREAIARGVPVGSGGSRLLRGNHGEHEALETEAAAFFGAQSALSFNAGFTANSALFSTLPQRNDLVVFDELIHASAHHGMRTGRAECIGVRHNDAGAFEDAIARWRSRGGTGRVWIAVESLYSMDGDKAPLADLMAIADRHEAFLIIDEAHATGVFGKDGRGLGAALEGRENVITLHTCGKALGTCGAIICSSEILRDFLINWCRPFIYATAPSPLIAATIRASLKLLKSQPQRREKLARLIAFANEKLEAVTGLQGSGSQILPVIVGKDEHAVALARAMQKQGYDIRAIRPPTVPEGTSRVRIALTLNTSEAVVADMLAALGEKLAHLPK